MFVFLALHNVEYEDRELTLSLEMLMAVISFTLRKKVAQEI